MRKWVEGQWLVKGMGKEGSLAEAWERKRANGDRRERERKRERERGVERQEREKTKGEKGIK